MRWRWRGLLIALLVAAQLPAHLPAAYADQAPFWESPTGLVPGNPDIRVRMAAENGTADAQHGRPVRLDQVLEGWFGGHHRVNARQRRNVRSRLGPSLTRSGLTGTPGRSRPPPHAVRSPGRR